MSSKKYFDEIAGQWDQMRESLFSDNVRKAAIRAAGVQLVPIAADIGAGTGFITEELLRYGLRVIAVDQSPEMIGEMKRRFGVSGNVEYRVGESAPLPIDSESVNYAFGNMYLHHVESPADAVKEMARILKAGGALVITDADEHTYEFLRTEQHDRWVGFKRDDVRAWFEGAGLTDVKVDGVGEKCRSTSISSGEKIEINIFVTSGTKLNNSEKKVQDQ